jgi:hypothetical protein
MYNLGIKLNQDRERRLLRFILMVIVIYLCLHYSLGDAISQNDKIKLILSIMLGFMVVDTYVPRVKI